MKNLEKIKHLICNKVLTKTLLNQAFGGYLVDTGWVNSVIHQKPVDKEGKPLPWVTIPFIDFIQDRLNSNMTVFEYGSGNSTLFYSNYVKKVIAVEHDKKWLEYIQKNIADNVELKYIHLEYNGEYSRHSTSLNHKFDLIIVDGRDRVNCLKYAIDAINEQGCLILDDSERSQYIEGIDFILQNGFKRLDFWGMALGLNYKKCTTIFYRENNCLGI